MLRKCSREASSGTTPPYLRCTLTWEATTLDRISLPSATTAAAVSSQEDSIPRIRVAIDCTCCPFSYGSIRFGTPTGAALTSTVLRIIEEARSSRPVESGCLRFELFCTGILTKVHDK